MICACLALRSGVHADFVPIAFSPLQFVIGRYAGGRVVKQAPCYSILEAAVQRDMFPEMVAIEMQHPAIVA